MNWYKIIFLVLAIIFVSIYSYNYYTYKDNTPEVKSLKNINNCIAENETSLYGTIETKDFIMNIPNTWEVKTFANAQANSFVLGINEHDNTEFLSVWVGDYNKSTHDFLIDTLKPLSNYRIVDEKEVYSSMGKIRNIKIEFTNINNYTQDMYAVIKDNKAYLILLRTQKLNYNKYNDIVKKVICSFRNK